MEKEYTADEAALADLQTPKVTGMTPADAEAALEKKGLDSRTVGEGETVTAQVPAAGSVIPGESTVILYLGGAEPEETGTVPDVTGMSFTAARSKLESAGSSCGQRERPPIWAPPARLRARAWPAERLRPSAPS